MKQYKYPRTPHLPWSPGATSDDKYISSFESFRGKQIVVTEKMDGENTTIYPDGTCHARSIDSKYHESRAWINRFANVGFLMSEAASKENWRLCGENLFAEHSIHYDNLKSYFYLFGVWELDICLSWDFTVEVANKLGIVHVPVLYEGKFDELVLKALPATLTENQEGFVVRVKENIYPSGWNTCIAKWVRPNHVQTDEHWMNKPVVKNGLAPDAVKHDWM